VSIRLTAGVKGESEPTELERVVEAVLASSRAIVAVSARSIAGVAGVTLPQYRMLVVLSAAPTNLSGLARALDVAPSTAMRMIDRLEAAGLVSRAVPATNRRETRLALTAAGKRAVRTVTTRRRRDLRAIIERVPAGQRAQVAAAMAAFASAADELWGATLTDPV
jgi:DNA-binding MarR family transcriptional regulator